MKITMQTIQEEKLLNQFKLFSILFLALEYNALQEILIYDLYDPKIHHVKHCKISME